MSKVQVFILTHKFFDENYDNQLYVPILNGSALMEDDFGYTRDDTGDNISDLNPYYAELTGQYWAWKHSKADIMGFCHYRRYFAKNIFMKKLNKEDIEEILEDYDIIMPQLRHFYLSVCEYSTRNYFEETNFQRKEDYIVLRQIIKDDYPEYLDDFDELFSGKTIYLHNMFIAKKELVDDYFTWLFEILEKFRKRHDFSIYEGGSFRLLGFLSERLLSIYIKKHNLKVKEKYLYQPELVSSRFSVLSHRFPIILAIIDPIMKIVYKRQRRKNSDK